MTAGEQGYWPGLVDLKAGRISREIFVNEEIYREELERLFARAWLFVGHESQIPKPGDFFVSGMGEESVILCRDRAGEIHVFLNSCRHRGMKVCRYDEGSTPVFTCPYHGWRYGTDGKLVGVPYFREAYHSQLDRSQWGLVEVAQLCNHKGAIWATWDPATPSFAEYLGEFRALSRPDPGQLGRQHRRHRGAPRDPKMADPMQLEIPGRKFQWRQLSQHQPPLGRPCWHRPVGKRAARHAREGAGAAAADLVLRSRPSDWGLSATARPADPAGLRPFADRLRVFRALRRDAAPASWRMGPGDRQPRRSLPQYRPPSAPAAHDRGVAS